MSGNVCSPLPEGAARDGRYWARTSDPQLVEVEISVNEYTRELRKCVRCVGFTGSNRRQTHTRYAVTQCVCVDFGPGLDQVWIQRIG